MSTKDFGTVEYAGAGKTLRITQQPYAAGTQDSPVYRAHAVDDDGNSYRVIWPMTGPEATDESNAADWRNYTIETD